MNVKYNVEKLSFETLYESLNKIMFRVNLW